MSTTDPRRPRSDFALIFLLALLALVVAILLLASFPIAETAAAERADRYCRAFSCDPILKPP